MPTFDGPNQIITLDSGGGTITAADLYSYWKAWVLAGNAQFIPAFSTTGGDDLGGGVNLDGYFFFNNLDGWRIKPFEEDGYWLIDGNLYLTDPNGQYRIPTDGTFTTGVDVRLAVRATKVSSGSAVTSQDKIDIANETISRAQTDPIHANIKEVNDTTVTGSGTEPDPWGP